MNNKSSVYIRARFLKFFENLGHKVVASDSLIPSGDPTLLFTSAGMVQFKKNFLGQSKDTFTRATSAQKCLRTSDIDNVGLTNRHLTFFEMLGNFSFGDYFKKESIAWGWEFLTKEMGLPVEKLYATVYKDDKEAADIWSKIVKSDHIIPMGDDTNFWNMGPTGPCGPCSEILLDLGQEMGCGKPDCGPQCSCNRYLEIWNHVFTQFDRQADGTLKDLPKKNIDTGMGMERLVAAVNGKQNVFETDLFVPLISSAAEMLSIHEDGANLSGLRLIADHSRAITFMISDGILPSNEGRGYVLRRLLRRALRKAKLLGANKALLHKMTSHVIDIMKDGYTELAARRENIASVTKMEEEKFLETLEAGSRMLEGLISKYSSNISTKGNAIASKFVIPGDEVFKLYDTYGFPVELTREIAGEHNLTIDEPGFTLAQKGAQEKSRATWSGSGEKDQSFYISLNKELGDTTFRSYEYFSLTTKIAALMQNGKRVSEIAEGEEGEAMFTETPFYGESGGQMGDRGIITASDVSAQVLDTTKPTGGLIIHKVKVTKGVLKEGAMIEASVDMERRKSIMRHHTATHLLHKALRQILGPHVAQAGSLVGPDSFRFDFTHFAALKPREIEAVEDIVNRAILENMPVTIKEMKLADARTAGAMALFGEKYGEVVRSVTVKTDTNDEPFSMELCGGTHVGRTGDIGFFKITGEYSVASGTRRIEAVAGEAAALSVRANENVIKDAASCLKVPVNEISTRLEKLISQQKESEKEIVKLKGLVAMGGSGTGNVGDEVITVKGVKLLSKVVTGLDASALRNFADTLRGKIGSGIVVAFNTSEDKVSFIVTLSEDALKAGFNAGAIAKKISGILGGSGGGKPDFAQGGGKDVSKVKEALTKISELL